MFGEGALDAEDGGDDMEERVGEGWREEPWQERGVVYRREGC